MNNWILIEKIKDKERYRHRYILNRFRLVTYQPNTIKKEIFQDGKLDDPTVTKQPSDADTRIVSDAYQNTNFGSEVGTWVAHKETPQIDRGLWKFDFSADVPAGATINTATLSLYYATSFGVSSGQTEWVYRVTQTAWTDLGATWNKYNGATAWTTAGGDFTTTDGASTTVPASTGVWMAWTVTAQVQYALNSVSGVAHFLGKLATESGFKGTYFYSKNYTTDLTLRPKLVIDYTEPSVGQPTQLRTRRVEGMNYIGGN